MDGFPLCIKLLRVKRTEDGQALNFTSLVVLPSYPKERCMSRFFEPNDDFIRQLGHSCWIYCIISSQYGTLALFHNRTGTVIDLKELQEPGSNCASYADGLWTLASCMHDTRDLYI